MKKIFLMFFMIISILGMAFNFYNPLGPTLLPAAGIYNTDIENLEKGYWKNIDEAQTLLLKGQADFIVLPVALGAQIIDKGANYKLAGVSLWKTFSLVGKTDIKSIKELENKEILTIHGPGQTGDLVLKILKEEKDMNFNIVYVKNGADIIQMLASGKYSYAVLPEPFVSLAEVKTSGKIKPILDIENLYANLTGQFARIPVAGLFVKNGIDQEYADKIIKEYEKSSNEYFKNNQDKAIEFVFEVMNGKMPKAVLKKAANRSYIKYIEDEDSVMKYFEVLKKYGILENYSERIFF